MKQFHLPAHINQSHQLIGHSCNAIAINTFLMMSLFNASSNSCCSGTDNSFVKPAMLELSVQRCRSHSVSKYFFTRSCKLGGKLRYLHQQGRPLRLSDYIPVSKHGNCGRSPHPAIRCVQSRVELPTIRGHASNHLCNLQQQTHSLK